LQERPLSVLDQLEKLYSLDPGSMWGLLESFPKQVETAGELSGKIHLPIPAPISGIVITGLGGSAIGGDVAKSAVGDKLRVPLLVNRDYRLPAFVDSTWFVIVSSYSGNTEETLSAYRDARRINAPSACISSGGKISEMAREDHVPVIKIPSGLPPRAALGYSSITLLGVLRALDLIPDPRGEVMETVALLSSLATRYSTRKPESENLAKALARTMHGKLIAIYASVGILDSAAVRWRGQMEENAKNLAFHHSLPEMNHNELVGWECPSEILSRLAVFFLRDREDHPQVQRRIDWTKQWIEPRAGTVREFWSEGHSRLARIFSLISLGDFASLYLAYLNGVDPTAVEAIDSLKRHLGDSSSL
jgi:glucose/mannose-6-phosphate isomerase